ncbi:hypothetical protein BHM03_00005963 [Ensete ventricosum]|nr:hypothetical protein BHM03_00005963 [Ensete ventricosum]
MFTNANCNRRYACFVYHGSVLSFLSQKRAGMCLSGLQCSPWSPANNKRELQSCQFPRDSIQAKLDVGEGDRGEGGTAVDESHHYSLIKIMFYASYWVESRSIGTPVFASNPSPSYELIMRRERNEDKPIKISSWNHYRLVEQEVEASSQLASSNDHASCGCASFSCFGCSSARLDEPYSRKVSLVHQSKSPSDSSSSSDRGKLTINDAVKWDERKTCLKSNMKKPSIGYSMVCEADDARELLAEADNKTSCYTVGRKVQWTDKCGKELAEIREFEARYV